MSIKFSSSLWGRVFFCFALLAVTVMGQSVTGTISGTIVDTSENAIVGAIVTVTDTTTGSKRTVTTNNTGMFVISALQPNIYTIKVEHGGFRSLERQNTVLTANETLSVGRLVMEIGQITEVVTTVAEGATIEKESSDLSGRLTADQISLISTKGRSITSLLTLIPGVAYIDDPESVGDGFGTDLPNVNGQRGRSTSSAVNGLNASEPSGANKISMTVNQDAIAEVKVLRNSYAAEFGNNGGAQIDIVTKSGKQKYFGSAYMFLRNEALNANSFFNNRLGLSRPLYRHNIWGFNVGGPVQVPWLFPNKEKKNLFFFYSLENPHTITPTSARFVTVPTALERAGDFSQSIVGINPTTGVTSKAFIRDPKLAGVCNATDQTACFRDITRATSNNPKGLNIIPLDRIYSSGASLLNYFPLPNQSFSYADSLKRSYNYVAQKSMNVPKRNHVVRIDYKATEKDTIFANLLLWRADNEGFDTSGWPNNEQSRWGISSHYLYQEKGMSVNWLRLISGSIVNEVSIGARHGSEGFVPSDGEIDRLSRSTLKYTAPQLFPQNNTLGTIPRVTNLGGLSNTTAAIINWLDRWGEIGHDYILPAITNNLTITRSNHNLKFGFSLERIRNGEARGGNWSGTFSFAGSGDSTAQSLGNTGHPYANALTGFFASYSESSSRPHTDLERTLIQWYAQDQWRAGSRLTLNYGMRMGWFSHWSQRQLDAANFDPSRFDPSKAPVLYRPHCVKPVTAAACATGDRRARNPLTNTLHNQNLVGTFVPGSGDMLNGIVLGTDSATPHGFKKPAPIQFEPRLGFALSLFQSGKTVLRGHAGMYHSSRTGGGTSGGSLVGNPPFQRNLTITNGYINDLENLVGTALERPTGLNGLQVDGKTPTIYNFSLGIQQDIGYGTVVEIAYVGSQARHLGELRNINAVPDGASFVDLHPENRNPFSTTNALGGGALADDFLRPYQGYGDINIVTNSGNSNYNALQAQLTRRYARGFQFGMSYTWHKTLDYANDDNASISFPRPYKQFNYGPADHDQTHIFSANYIWDLPRPSRILNNGFIKNVFDNWQLSGTTSLVSGRPEGVGFGTSGSIIVTIASGESCPPGTIKTAATSCTLILDYTGGAIGARANVICDPNNRVANTADGTPVFIDSSCFARPSERGDIGNTPRNMIRRPGVINFNMALFKNVNVKEKLKIQFRWETYNLFNHTNFSDVDTTLTYGVVDNQIVQTNVRFGQPTGARPPRVMQGSLRISF